MAARPNFLEVETVEEANRVDLNEYTFNRFSETRQRYVFSKRMRK